MLERKPQSMKRKFGHLLEKRVAMFGKGGIVEGGVGGERKGDGSLRSRRGGRGESKVGPVGQK